jgi:hypothetical protein
VHGRTLALRHWNEHCIQCTYCENERSLSGTNWISLLLIQFNSDLHFRFSSHCFFVFQAYINPELEFIHVSTNDVLGGFIVTCTLNVAVLLAWTLVSPLEWTRVQMDATDVFNRHLESYATCRSDHSLPFVVAIIVLNALFLLVGTWWAYRSRNVETEYNESFYIGVSMAAILQAWIMGIPIQGVVRDIPQATFYVQIGMVFVTSQAIVSLVYLPKMMFLRSEIRNE